MASATEPRKRKGRSSEPTVDRLPPLENGDHLDQKTFHERYEAMPEDFRAELIGGIVYVSSPLKRRHGKAHLLLGRWVSEYDEATPGSEGVDNATVILGADKEPQPDISLRILPEYGGQTRGGEDDYIEGPPEWVSEVASATESIDLNAKRRDYEQAGVREYVVVALRQQQVFWFVRRRGRFRELAPGTDGILRSEVFPGLWLDPAALLRRDRGRVLEVLRQGLASPEHAAFVAKLSGQKRG